VVWCYEITNTSCREPSKPLRDFRRLRCRLSEFGLEVNSSCSNSPNSQSRQLNLPALVWANSICHGRSITSPRIAIQLQLQLLVSLPTTHFLERQFFGFLYILGSASVGQAQRRQRHAARASRSKTSSISPTAHLQSTLSLTNSTLPKATQHCSRLSSRSPRASALLFLPPPYYGKPALASRQPSVSTVTC
jgi:hypothetical protein